MRTRFRIDVLRRFGKDAVDGLAFVLDPASVHHVRDVGATTATYLEVFPRAHIDCFEADPRSSHTLHERFDGEVRMTVTEAAVSDQQDLPTTFHLTATEGTSSLLAPLEADATTGNALFLGADLRDELAGRLGPDTFTRRYGHPPHQRRSSPRSSR